MAKHLPRTLVRSAVSRPCLVETISSLELSLPALQLAPNTGKPPSCGQDRSFSSLSSKKAENEYVSPFKDFFEQVKTNTYPYADLNFDKPERTYLKCGIPEDTLRFLTVCYGRLQLAPHVQPWEHRVTVRVSMDDIPFETPLEIQFFKEIVGSRLRDKTLQLSSNQFGSRIENKRHLESMLDRIVLGAKRLAKETEQAALEAPQTESSAAVRSADNDTTTDASKNQTSDTEKE